MLISLTNFHSSLIRSFPPDFEHEASTWEEAISPWVSYTDEMAEDNRLFKRITLLAEQGAYVQASIIDNYDNDDVMKSQDAIDAILNDGMLSPRWAGREWTYEIPLIVLEDAYIDGAEPPTGNVVVISADDDHTTILSLVRLGQVDMTVVDD